MSGEVPTFDLQSHSRHSDGELSPAEVVAAAADAGVKLLALSDHDTVAGVGEAAAAAGQLGIGLVPAVEISAVDEAAPDLHVLGYRIDEREPALLEHLERYRGDRERRSGAVVAALRELGFELGEESLERRARAGKTLGRPHIAGAVLAHPANAERLADEGIADPASFVAAYLAEGRPAFRRRLIPSVAEAICTIHHAGGLAVWAHPFWDISDPGRVLEALDRFRGQGVDGVEAFYLTHTAEQTSLLARRAAELEMLSTGSSDFHGPSHRLMFTFRAFRTYGLTPNLGALADSAVS